MAGLFFFWILRSFAWRVFESQGPRSADAEAADALSLALSVRVCSWGKLIRTNLYQNMLVNKKFCPNRNDERCPPARTGGSGAAVSPPPDVRQHAFFSSRSACGCAILFGGGDAAAP
jgi:hypothetical protein